MNDPNTSNRLIAHQLSPSPRSLGCVWACLVLGLTLGLGPLALAQDPAISSEPDDAVVSFLDLSATAYSEGRRKLFRNNGDGTFSEIVVGSLVTASRSAQGQGFLWFDYDDDGFLDLYAPT